MRTLRRCTLTTIILAQLALAPGLALAQQETPPATPQAEPSPADVGDADTDVVAPAELGADPDTRTLETVVVSGEIQFRNRTATVAPVLVYDRQFFQKFEPVSVGDQLRRVPGVAFTSDIGESDAPQLRGLGQGYTQILINGRPLPGAGNDRTVFVDRIPAEIVDRIEIIRSPSADIDSQGV
ncbi:MAG: TonB-dependent receptor plug domain-containing protein, partial [Xanthomonadales bacterium]|nr:TonB-dependent receptor plug domain-containing protein [Xanthomonadales bacterium]